MHMPVERRNECVYTCGRGMIVQHCVHRGSVGALASSVCLSFSRSSQRSWNIYIGEFMGSCLTPPMRSFYSAAAIAAGRYEPVVAKKRPIIIYFRNAYKTKGRITTSSRNVTFARTGDYNIGQKRFSRSQMWICRVTWGNARARKKKGLPVGVIAFVCVKHCESMSHKWFCNISYKL